MQLALVAKHSSERYLRVYQRGAQLAERLARYEVVEPFEAKSGTLITR
jgi:DNA relaxase NicK